MNDKNLPPDNNLESLEELTQKVDNIIASLEAEKDLQNSVESYQELLRLNVVIEKKLKRTTKIINKETKKKINSIILKRNEK